MIYQSLSRRSGFGFNPRGRGSCLILSAARLDYFLVVEAMLSRNSGSAKLSSVSNTMTAQDGCFWFSIRRLTAGSSRGSSCQAPCEERATWLDRRKRGVLLSPKLKYHWLAHTRSAEQAMSHGLTLDRGE